MSRRPSSPAGPAPGGAPSPPRWPRRPPSTSSWKPSPPPGSPKTSSPAAAARSLCSCREGSAMADADDVRRLAVALPYVEEIDSDGFDFRVGGKGFVWSYPERRPGQRRVIRTDIAVLYVGDEAEKQALLLGEPDLFFTTPGYDGWPLVMLRLAEVDAARLDELINDAWRMGSPADLDVRP